MTAGPIASSVRSVPSFPSGDDGDGFQVGPRAILNAIADPVLVVGPAGAIRYVNTAAEQFFEASASHLGGQQLTDLVPGDSPLLALIDQVRQSGASVSEYGVSLETPKIGPHFVTIQVAALAENDGAVVGPSTTARSRARSTASSPTATPPVR